jgi:hypothetical protein
VRRGGHVRHGEPRLGHGFVERAGGGRATTFPRRGREGLRWNEIWVGRGHRPGMVAGFLPTLSVE